MSAEDHMPVQAESYQVSPDGRLAMGSFTATAYGEYDPELQLSDEQIEAMKQKLRDDRFLTAEVCGQLALDIDEHRSARGDYEHVSKETRKFWNVTYAAQTALLLTTILSDEGAKPWPERVTPPATFNKAIKKVEARRLANAQEREARHRG